MMALCLLLAAASPAVEAASRPAITRETRPDLFADEPPGLTAASQPQAPSPKETPLGFWVSNLLRTTLVLGVVVLLAYLILNKGLGRLLKLTGAASAGKHMTLLERMALGPRHNLFLVEVAGRRYVIGTSDQNTQLIAALDAQTRAVDAPEKVAP